MTDNTMFVAMTLSASAASLALSGGVAEELMRKIRIATISVFGAHALGITVLVPISSRLGSILNIIALAWLILATLAVACRRVLGDFAGRRASHIGG